MPAIRGDPEEIQCIIRLPGDPREVVIGFLCLWGSNNSTLHKDGKTAAPNLMFCNIQLVDLSKYVTFDEMNKPQCTSFRHITHVLILYVLHTAVQELKTVAGGGRQRSRGHGLKIRGKSRKNRLGNVMKKV